MLRLSASIRGVPARSSCSWKMHGSVWASAGIAFLKGPGATCLAKRIPVSTYHHIQPALDNPDGNPFAVKVCDIWVHKLQKPSEHMADTMTWMRTPQKVQTPYISSRNSVQVPGSIVDMVFGAE